MSDDFEAFQSAFLRRPTDVFVGWDGDLADVFDDLESQFKSRAKALHRALRLAAPSIKLMQVQEALAGALGFPRIHAMQQSFKAVLAELKRLEPSKRGAWLREHEKLLAPYSRLIEVQTNFAASALPPREGQLRLLEQLAQSLAKSLSVQVGVIQDGIAAGWTGSATWAKFVNRNPSNTPLTQSLLTFTVEGDPRSRKSQGFLHLSGEGDWIWDNVLGSDAEGESPETLAQARKALEHALSVAEQYPNHYIAWSAAASAAEDFHQELGLKWSQVLAFVDKGLQQVQDQIPKGFNGTMLWGHLDNRPFIRMLYQKLSLELQTKGGFARARKTANTLMRLSPVGGAIVGRAPILIGTNASPEVRRRLCNAALRNGDPSSLMHVGLVQVFAEKAGRGQEEGARYFIESIFRVPEFGALLLGEPKTRPYQQYSRPEGYEDLFDEVNDILAFLAVVPKLGEWVVSVLRDKALLETELYLDALYGTRETGLKRVEWDRAVEEAAALHAKLILQAYPYSH